MTSDWWLPDKFRCRDVLLPWEASSYHFLLVDLDPRGVAAGNLVELVRFGWLALHVAAPPEGVIRGVAIIERAVDGVPICEALRDRMMSKVLLS